MTTLINHLEATGGRLGLQTMCEAGGMANATLIERLARRSSTMDLTGGSAVVTGGASGLGLATVRALAARKVEVVMLDLPTSAGAEVAPTVDGSVQFAPGDVTDTASVEAALDLAEATRPASRARALRGQGRHRTRGRAGRQSRARSRCTRA